MHHHISTLTTALFLLSTTCIVQAQWEPVGQANFSPGMTEYNTMDIGPDNQPAVAFLDMNNGSKVTAMRYTGSGWQLWGDPGFSDGQAMALTMKINAAGAPFVAYRDLSNNLRITVMHLNGGTWQRVGTSGPSAGAGYNPSLAFDAAGVPYVAFRDETQSNYLTVKRFVNSEWQTVGSEGFSDITAQVVDLRFNNAGIPYVAIDGNSAGSRVYRLAGNVWEQAGTIASLYNCRIAALHFDAQDVPHIAYFDMSNSAAMVKKLVGDTWIAVGGSVSTPDESPQAIQLAIHTDGTIYVVFSDTDLAMRLTARKYANGAWTTVGGTGFTATLTSYITLALNDEGVPHVGIKDLSSGMGKATVLRYNEGVNSVDERAAEALHLLPNPACEQVTLSGLPTQAQVTVYDPAGKAVRAMVADNSTYTFNTTELHPGLYVVRVKSSTIDHNLRLVVTH